MNNYTQGGQTIRYTNGTGSVIAAGAVVMVGRIAGVAVDTIAISGDGVLQVTGVFRLPKTAALAISQGDAVYWSGTAVTKTPGQSAIGTAHAAALSAGTTVDVLLNAVPETITARGSNGIGVPFFSQHDCSAAAASHTLFDANFPRAARLVDVIVECVGANTSGTIAIGNGTNAITNAIVCAVDNVITRAGTIDNAYSTLAAGASVVATKNAAADKGFVTLVWMPL